MEILDIFYVPLVYGGIVLLVFLITFLLLWALMLCTTRVIGSNQENCYCVCCNITVDTATEPATNPSQPGTHHIYRRDIDVCNDSTNTMTCGDQTTQTVGQGLNVDNGGAEETCTGSPKPHNHDQVEMSYLHNID